VTRSGSMITLTYKTPAAIRWCKDCERILVVNEATYQAVSLTGFEAALWQWYSLSLTDHEVLAFAQECLQVSPEETRAQVNQIISGWVEEDLLIIEDPL
jgi:hypothetical protein